MSCINKSENILMEILVKSSFSLFLLSLRHTVTCIQIYSDIPTHMQICIHTHTYTCICTIFPFKLFNGFK